MTIRRDNDALEYCTGWGRTAGRICTVVDQPDDLADVVVSRGGRGVLARGLGRSYGDSSINGGGTLIRLGDGIDLDVQTGVARCSGGATIDGLYRTGMPHGLAVPVTPGTRQVTIGGAIAADVHGKNHHVAGTFSRHVHALTLMDGTGTVHRVGPGDAVFNATAGGMGLTGIIVEAEIQLERVASGDIVETTSKHAHFDALLAAMADDSAPFSVAWVDLVNRRGRGVYGTGRWAERGEGGEPAAPPVRRLTVPTGRFNVVRTASVHAFNTAWWLQSRPGRRIVPYHAYFHPLDAVDAWNRLYGRSGFIQYQFVVPDTGVDTLRSITAAIIARRVGTPMVVLKRFGASGSGLLSFPIPGWTLAVDIPIGVDGLGTLLRGFDEQVVAAGGRVYLAKDSTLTRETFLAMYPQAAEFERVQARLDPDGRFCSDQARRLGITRAARVRSGMSGTLGDMNDGSART